MEYESAPMWKVCTGLIPSAYASQLPPMIPTAQPLNSALAPNQPTNRPNTTAGKVCRIHTPPSNCRSSANLVGKNRMNTSAPNLSTSNTILATSASPSRDTYGFTYCFQRLRVNRLAAPLDNSAAGNRAPRAIEANAKPLYQLGNIALNSAGRM